MRIELDVEPDPVYEVGCNIGLVQANAWVEDESRGEALLLGPNPQFAVSTFLNLTHLISFLHSPNFSLNQTCLPKGCHIKHLARSRKAASSLVPIPANIAPEDTGSGTSGLRRSRA